MKKNSINNKDLIKKKIEYRHKNILFLDKNQEKNNSEMNDRDLRRFNKVSPKPDISKLSRDERRVGNYGKLSEHVYVKNDNVNYDVVVCIPSHNRYDKLKRIIEQLINSNSKYSYLMVILNDGSSDERYDTLTTEFPGICYLKNDLANGKVLHWYCYNQLWKILRTVTSHVVLQMDDDFILCENFLDKIVDMFFEKKKENVKIMAISPHLWSFKEKSDYELWWKRTDFVDGIALIDYNVIKFIDFELQPVDVNEVIKPGVPVKAWPQISKGIKDYGGIIFRTSESLVYHDGNDDSKLHSDIRKDNLNGVYTQKYIGKI